jgi:translation initiation factor IF-2
MQQLRVVDLARTMGITSTELIFKLRSIGVSVAGEEDTLDLSTVRSIITGETLQKRPREVIVRSEPREEEGAAGTTARDRVAARRRRRQVVATDKKIREFAPPPAPPSEEEEVTAEVEVEELPEIEEAETEVAAAPAEEEIAVAPEEPEEEQPLVAEEAVEAEPVEAAEAAPPAAAAPEAADRGEEEEEEIKPAPEVTEEELTAQRERQEEPTRVRRVRAKTPLEQSLRELSPEEIREQLQAQKKAEKSRKERRPAPGRKAKSAADAQEIRELLTKFEEQKLKGQQEPAGGPSRPGPRPSGRRPSKRARRRQQQEDGRPTPPRPSRTVQFRDGDKPEGPVILSEMVTARELAEKLNVTAKDLLGLLIQRGVMVTTNQVLPHELAEEICAELGVDAMVASAEEVIEYEREESMESVGPAEPRPPVVTVMGHVDHGKTSLLDAIRSSRVAEQEAGGITQHIGASRITTDDGRAVVFVDTPGHEAFTQMRARGAQVTDIVVLVVAADDGVMPQTVEAINHARAANVPLVVAINKIDKANATPDRVKQQLAEHEVLLEAWGGDVPAVQVSAKTRQGIQDLLDMILLVAELKDLRASAEGPARGVVLEARKEKGRGIVATVLIQQGTLEVGDYFFCGSTWGRVRAITDDVGERVDTAGPTDPVEIMGFDDVPAAGDILQATVSEDKALEVASYRSQREKEEGLVGARKISLENLFDEIAESETKTLNVVVKADVQGSVEVLRDTLENLGTEKVKINVLHGSVGAITTNDVMLASASNAIIIGFAVRPERTARELADTEQVDVRLYTVIYELIDDVKKAMVGLLEPVYREEELGHAEVREVFRIPKIGAIAGSRVVDGVIVRNAKARLLRDHKVVYDGHVSSLKRFKEDASEVREGFECGIGLERFQDVKEGDVIEAYRMIEMTPEL